MQTITPCLWFDGNGEEAANFYMSLFRNSKVVGVILNADDGPGPKGSVLMMSIQLDGQELQILNGGPQYKFTPAISLSVSCATQAEVDRLWARLTADGGEEVQCGWLTDKYGVSWQIVPAALHAPPPGGMKARATPGTRHDAQPVLATRDGGVELAAHDHPPPACGVVDADPASMECVLR